MIDFIRDNISWVKDFVTLGFAIIASIIGILTYRRARYTLLQPIRSETIKKQSEILTNLLDFLKVNNTAFESGIDYFNIVQLNVYMVLNDYGFVFKNHETLIKETQKDISSWIPCGKSKVLHDVEVIQTFKTLAEKHDEIDIGKKKYDLLKEGIADVDKLYITHNHSDFMSQLSTFISNPFIPTSFVSIMKEYSHSIHYNLSVVIKDELEKFLIEFSDYYFKEGNAPEFDSVGVYNSFNHARKHHNMTLQSIRKEIREYMLIDKQW